MNRFLVMFLDGSVIGIGYHFGKKRFIVGGAISREGLIVSIIHEFIESDEYKRFTPSKSKIKYLVYMEPNTFLSLKKELEQNFVLKSVHTFGRLMR